MKRGNVDPMLILKDEVSSIVGEQLSIRFEVVEPRDDDFGAENQVTIGLWEGDREVDFCHITLDQVKSLINYLKELI